MENHCQVEGPKELGLLLFLILMNDCGFDNNGKDIGTTITKKKNKFAPNTLHSKFVDDLTILEAFNLKEAIITNLDRLLPDPFHARLGQKLDADKSKVYDQIGIIQNYATANEMKLNFKKCKFMLFNPTINYDFIPEYKVEGNSFETVEEMRLLGLTIRNDLKWQANTEDIIKRAYKKLWMIKRLKAHGACLEDLDVWVFLFRFVPAKLYAQ